MHQVWECSKKCRQRNRVQYTYLFFNICQVTPTVPLWQTFTLPVLRMAPPVKACLGPQTEPSVVETGFCGGSVGFMWTNRLPLYTSTYAAQNSIWLYCDSSLPAWILMRTGTVGGWKESNGDRVFQVQVCSDFIQLFLGTLKGLFLLEGFTDIWTFFFKLLLQLKLLAWPLHKNMRFGH